MPFSVEMSLAHAWKVTKSTARTVFPSTIVRVVTVVAWVRLSVFIQALVQACVYAPLGISWTQMEQIVTNA